MLDKDKKIILFNFCPQKFGIDDYNNIDVVYNQIYDSLRNGFDESIKLVGMIYLSNQELPMLEVVDKPSRALKQKIKDYLEYIKTINNVEEVTQGEEYKELLAELSK